MAEATKRYAVVTGANKGIGFGICKQLASNEITVVLTARDEKRGLEAVEKLKELGLPGLVVFHQLDVTDPESIGSLADFIRTQFGKLDILVNNAGIPGADVDGEALAASGVMEKGAGIDWSKIVTENYESAEAGLKTNYYGAKGSTKALIPLLQLSDSPKIVNVSSSMGSLENIPNGWPKEVNNAGIAGGIVNGEAVLRRKGGEKVDWNIVVRQSYELAEESVKTNFYGAERVTEALLPLLQLSTSPKIVNVSSKMGLLKNVTNEWARGVFSDIENLTKERLDEVLREFLKDYKEGSLETRNWPSFISGYTMSKAALNAYTRMLAKKFPNFRINCLCPDYVKTDMNENTGFLSINEGAESPVRLALLADSGPSGLFFNRNEVISF